MTKGITSYLTILLLVALSSCAPAHIPVSASMHWSLKAGLYWAWARQAGGGCVSWMATEDWASVQAVIDKPCVRTSKTDYLDGQGLIYFSGVDNLTFKGLWPWTADTFNQRIVFDSNGMVETILPCPHSISAVQISKMLLVIRAAEKEATTMKERRVLSRIAERLASVDGAALSSSQGGCTDEKASDPKKLSERPDPWDG